MLRHYTIKLALTTLLTLTWPVTNSTAQTYTPGTHVTCVADWGAISAGTQRALGGQVPGSSNFRKDPAINFAAIDFVVRIDGSPDRASASPTAWRDTNFIGQSRSGPADQHTSLRFVDSFIEMVRTGTAPKVKISDALIFIAGAKETKNASGAVIKTDYWFPYTLSMPVHSFRDVTISTVFRESTNLLANSTVPISVSEGLLSYTLNIDSVEGAPLNLQPISNVQVTRASPDGTSSVVSVVPVRCEAQKLVSCDATHEQNCSTAFDFSDRFVDDNLYKRAAKDVIGGAGPVSKTLYRDDLATRERLCQENGLGSFDSIGWNPAWSRAPTNCATETVLSWDGSTWQRTSSCGGARIITKHACLTPTVVG
jgi:hypothetical protein